MSFNLPNPCLLGLLLVISTHNGPQLVYKYPPTLSDNPIDNDLDDDEYKVDDFSDEENEVLNEWDSKHYNFYSGTKKDLLLFLDDQEKFRKSKMGHKSKKSVESISFDDMLKKTVSGVSDQTNNSKSSIQVDSSSVFGVEEDYLVEMLCPPREMCNSRFEINIDDFIYMGLPVHCNDNGSWKKKNKLVSNDDTKLDESLDSPKITSMNMFHLVFIMNPPVIESNYRIDEMYHYVASRLSLVLRHEQQKHDYIWQQVKLISKLKQDFKNQSNFNNLDSFLGEKSSLCKLIIDCYNFISNSEIANLSINNKLRSFQIPVKTEFHSLPQLTVPFLPGSHLSSTVSLVGKTGLINVGETTRFGMDNAMSMMMGNLANQNNDIGGMDKLDEDDTNSTADDIIYLALLLLDDPETIIKDIKAESDSVLANFIRMIKPTESLIRLHSKLQNETNSLMLDIAQLKSFAFHLIYWRRARVIHPLNTRSIYIVSPMAPITINMYNDILTFSKTFPSMPSLAQFLKLLSSPSKKPRQFMAIIPSKDHKDLYLQALSWLLRHGYVTQLHTFIWLKVSRKVKMKVEEDMENENNHKKSKPRISNIHGTDNTSKNTKNGNVNKRISSNPSSYERDIDDIANGIKGINGPEVILEEDEDTIILDPGRATTLERKWIHKIVTEECNLASELVVIFYDILKYMNGKTSLELLLLRENISREDFRRLFSQIEDHIISVRHW